MRLAEQRVLVTGASGFIGGRLVEKLILEEGARVNCLIRNWHKAVWVSRTTADLYPGEVFDASAVSTAMKGCQVVMHCASGGVTRDELFQTNVEGTRVLLEAAKRAGVQRFIFVSTIAVHGASPPDNFNEDAPYDDWGRAYPASKIAAERVVFDYNQQHHVPAVIIRPTFVWGPRSNNFTIGPLMAMKAGRFRWIDNGRGTCLAVHVDNLVESLILAAVEPKAIGNAFLITDQANITWRDFFQPYLDLLNIADVPSIKSRSLLTQLACRSKELAAGVVDRLRGDGKSVPVRAIRRAFHEIDAYISQRGYPSLWDLYKFARVGSIDTTRPRDLLHYRPVIDFPEAVEQTTRWVQSQMAFRLNLSTQSALVNLPAIVNPNHVS